MCLRKYTDEYVWSHEEKERILHDHFLNIIGTSEHIITTINWVKLELPQIVGQHLDDPVSKAEVMKAIAELPTEKAPARTALSEYSLGHARMLSSMKSWLPSIAYTIQLQDLSPS
jgi:hypothetical protein